MEKIYLIGSLYEVVFILFNEVSVYITKRPDLRKTVRGWKDPIIANNIITTKNVERGWS